MWDCCGFCTRWRTGWDCVFRLPTSTTGHGVKRREPMRLSWPTWPARWACRSTSASGGPAVSPHFESDARRARYDWLLDIARARHASTVVVGHTRDDQAETILHRIIRGTGPKGLAGIPWTRRLASEPAITLVRPLLSVSRDEIREYLAALGQPFREDHSNTDLNRTRARIRHDLLPKIVSEYNPQAALALVRLGSLAASFQLAIEADVRKLARSSVITRGTEAVVLKHPYLSSIPSFLRAEVLRRIWKSVGWPEARMSARRWRRLAALGEKRRSRPSRSASASPFPKRANSSSCDGRQRSGNPHRRLPVPRNRSCLISPVQCSSHGRAAGSNATGSTGE